MNDRSRGDRVVATESAGTRLGRALRHAAPWLVALAVAGCGDGEAPRVDVDDGGIDASTDAAVDAQPDGPTEPPAYTQSFPVQLNRQLDVLFVVDNSGGMGRKQADLVAGFPTLIERLSTLQGGLPDLHLGVVSSNVGAAGASGVPGCNGQGDDGNLQARVFPEGLTGCPGLDGNTFVSDIAQADGSRTRNYTGSLPDAFACMASLGTAGCGFEMHLESAYRAFQPGKNPGFLRADAALAVIFVADEDDCSTEMGAMFGDPTASLSSPLGPRTSFRCHDFGVVCDNDPTPRAFGDKVGCKPQENSQYQFEIEKYVSFFRALKADPSLVTVAGILGTFDPTTGALTVGQDPTANGALGQPAVLRSCGINATDPAAGASPPVRLAKFLAAFPGRHLATSLCDQNLNDALAAIAAQIKQTAGDPCLGQLPDLEPQQPGLQHACTATDVRAGQRQPVPACPDGQAAPTPCWRFVPDAVRCTTSPAQLAFVVERGGVVPPVGMVTELRCTLPAR